MKITNKLIGALIIGMVAVTSCADVPQTEIDAATAAIETAKAAGAEVYVTEQYNALNDSMAVAMASLEEQKSKFFKKYTKTVEKLTQVTAMANEVSANTEATKEAVKAEILASMEEVQTLVAQGRQLITEAPKGKEGTTALEAIKTELDVVEASITESNTMFQNGELKPSLEKVKVAKEKASSINTELTEVISKYKAAPRRK
ncbi:hypothetical protein [Roseivirga seohaensis]|uniref:DUF4398 domain-containing protein n=1 Tax=Roseivirga seohaensis subsp. aquiponti TaxID=1566026 RepID=A0A0L8AMC1_9BACT|nr:hypothetical protein [Roseivirga seohaensis]KOF03396.1 hypothetical protein OB69_05735 [Roseivirga seohaensis subsp. aquiponti]|tara:strand:+ start:56 stop:661 length:606 start_codon:yes stop_codon:yes gene_type:complete